jgi:hypothetical protein
MAPHAKMLLMGPDVFSLSPGEEQRLRTEAEKQLRLIRLEQVRAQSKAQAKARREEYAARVAMSKQGALLHSAAQFKTAKHAHMEALNDSLQQQLIDLGRAHRLANSSVLLAGFTAEDAKAKRAREAAARRERILASVAKIERERKESELQVLHEQAQQRQAVRAAQAALEREQAVQQAAVRAAEAAELAAREEAESLRLLDLAARCGMVCKTDTAVPQAGLRVQDFKRANVQVTIVRHGAEAGQHYGSAEHDPTLLVNTANTAAHESERLAAEAAAKAAHSATASTTAHSRGSKALNTERDRCVCSHHVYIITRVGHHSGRCRTSNHAHRHEAGNVMWCLQGVWHVLCIKVDAALE